MTDDAFRGLLKHGTAPLQPHRYEQDKELAAFIVMAQSSIECFCYAAFAVASHLDSSIAKMSTDGHRKNVNPASCRDVWGCIRQSGSLNTALTALVADSEWESLTTIRNKVIHRAQPGRALHLGGGVDSWLEIPLGEGLTTDRRQWVADQLSMLLDALGAEIA